MFCPNFSNKDVKREFDELTSAVGEPLAYYLWNQNQGYPLTKTSTGKDSKLYNDLVELTGNRIDAMKIKAKTFTESFKEWFGNSKVVDENGEPMIVYHGYKLRKDEYGEDFDIKIFDKQKAPKGFYFTKDKSYANTFTESYPGVKTTGLIPAFISLQNPKRQKDLFRTDPEIALRENNDGFVGNDMGFENEDIVVAFESEQIKSIFNQGTFDITNPNIYDNTEGLKKIDVKNPIETMMNNFEELFPEINFYTPQQRQVFADLVQEGHIRMDC